MNPEEAADFSEYDMERQCVGATTDSYMEDVCVTRRDLLLTFENAGAVDHFERWLNERGHADFILWLRERA